MLTVIASVSAMQAGSPQAAAVATARPSIAAPGGSVQLVFSLDPAALLEVTVGGQISCRVTSPSDVVTTPCERTLSILDARAVGQGRRDFVFDTTAPAQLGVYRVVFEARSTLTIPPTTYTADTAFTVVAASQLPSPSGTAPGPTPTGSNPGGNPTGNNPPGGSPGTTPDPGPPGKPGNGGGDQLIRGHAGDGFDSSRLFLGNGMAAGVLGLSLVANRFRLGK